MRRIPNSKGADSDASVVDPFVHLIPPEFDPKLPRTVESVGDGVLFDSRTMHCGGANESNRRRVLFYFSFEVAGSENPNAAVSSIRDELRGKIALADLVGA